MSSKSIIFTIIVSVLLSVIKCDTLLSLLKEKYKSEFDCSAITKTFIDNSGEVITMSLAPPLSLQLGIFVNDDRIEVLEKFEENPSAVLYDRVLKDFIVDSAVVAYEQDPISRQIIHHCLKFTSETEYFKMVLSSAIRKNVTNLILELISMENVSFIDEHQDTWDYHEISFTKAVVVTGKYQIAKYLIVKGVNLDSPDVWISHMANNPKLEYIDLIIDFLDFLILTIGSFDVNMKIHDCPLLNRVFFGRRDNEKNLLCNQLVAQHLVLRGANPNMIDYSGRTCLQIAQTLNIQLFPSEKLEAQYKFNNLNTI